MTLSPRQQQIAALIARGWTDKQIAAELGISEHTVSYHIAQLVHRLELDKSLNIRVQITNLMRAA